MASARNRHVFLGLVVGWALTGWVSIGAAQEPNAAVLAWKLAPDTALRLDFTQTIETATSVNKYALRVKMEMAAEITWKVIRVDAAGVMDIEQTLGRMYVKLTPAEGSGPIEYDSASTDPPRRTAREVASALEPLIGVKNLVRMNPRGEVLEVRALDAEEEGEALPQDKEDEPAPHETGPLGMANVNDILRQAIAVMPAEPVAPGASWSTTREATLPLGKVAVESQYTYRGSESREEQTLAAIDTTARLALTPAETAATKVELKQQKATGTLWFDAAAGRLAASQMQLDLVTQTPFRDEQITSRLNSTLNLKVSEQ